MAQGLDPHLRLQEDCIQGRGTRGIGIDFAPYVKALLPHPNQQLMNEIVAGIVEVTSQCWSIQRRRVGQQLLNAVGFRSIRTRGVTEVGAGLPPIEAGQALHFEKLAGGNALTHVSEGGADTQAACLQPLIEKLKDLVSFLQCWPSARPAIPCGTAFNGTANVFGPFETVQNLGSRKLMGDSLAIVHLAVAFTLLIPGTDIWAVGADLQVHDGSATVTQKELIGPGTNVVTVGIDKPRRNDMTGSVDSFLARYIRCRDDGDPSVFDPDIGNTVKHGLRVHHPAVVDDQVILSCHGR